MAKVRAGQFAHARDQLELARLIDATTATCSPGSTSRSPTSTPRPATSTPACAGARPWWPTSGSPPLTRGLAWAQLALIRQRTGHVDLGARGLLDGDPPARRRAGGGRPGPAQPRQPAPAPRQPAGRHRRPDPGRAASSAASVSTVQRAKAEHNLGFAQLLTGDVVGALQTMDSARDVLAPLSAVSRAVCEQDRAEALTAAGRVGDAIKALESAAAAYGSRRLRSFQAQCELSLAWSLLRAGPRPRPRGRPTRRPALPQPGQPGARRPCRGRGGPGRGRDGPSQAARLSSARDNVVAELRQQRPPARGGDRRAAGGAAGRPPRAAGRRRASASTRSASPRTPPWRPGCCGARSARSWRQARGDQRHARDHVRAGLADLHAWQSSFGSLDLQSTLVGHGRALAMQGLRLALADGSPALAYEWSERARALVARVTPVRPPADEQQAGLLTELRVLYADDPSPRSAEGRRLDQLRDQIREQSWYGDGGGQVGEPAALEEVQAELAATDACLVAHVAVDGWITAVVVTGTEAHTVRLCEAEPVGEDLDRIAADLDMAASQLAGPFAAAIRGSLDERLQVVSDLLVAPLLSLVGDRRVVLTPSGQLAGTPWTLLPGLAGRPVTVPPSATRWLELRRTARRRRPRVGLVAGPDVERAEEEVDAGVRRLAARHHADRRPCRRRRCRGPGRRRSTCCTWPAMAGIPATTRCSPRSSSPTGRGSATTSTSCRTPPALVVLSSCELGRASVRSGDEVVGMTAAWLHAGARCVTSSPTLVADDVACEVLAGWHARVAKGDAPADALADAARDLDDDAAPSPFVSFGAGW